MAYIQQLSNEKYQQPQLQLNNEEFNQVATTLNDMSCAITERQKTLRESKNRFECAMAGTNDGLWDWNFETHEVYYSPRWCEMLGYQYQELAPDLNSFISLVHPEDKDACDEHINRFLHGDSKHYHLSFKIKHKNGDTIYILSLAFLVCDENNGHNKVMSDSPAAKAIIFTEKKNNNKDKLH